MSRECQSERRISCPNSMFVSWGNSKAYPACCGAEGSLPCSQDLVTGFSPELNEFNPRPISLSLSLSHRHTHTHTHAHTPPRARARAHTLTNVFRFKTHCVMFIVFQWAWSVVYTDCWYSAFQIFNQLLLPSSFHSNQVWGPVSVVSSQHSSKAGDYPLLAVRVGVSDTQAHSYSRLSPPSTTWRKNFTSRSLSTFTPHQMLQREQIKEDELDGLWCVAKS